MLLVQKWSFFQLFFFKAIQSRKMFFTIFQNEKTPFQSIKTKSRKIDIFSKGVNPWISSKNGHFSNLFFLGNIGRENVFYDILERKNAFLGYQNKKFKKSKNLDFSKWVNPWFWSKNGLSSNFFFQAIQGRKMSFTIIQNEKTPFQAIKTRSSKSRKIDILSKGLTHFLVKKWPFFKLFFLGNIGQENVFYGILERKTAFLGYKKKKFKKWKN